MLEPTLEATLARLKAWLDANAVKAAEGKLTDADRAEALATNEDLCAWEAWEGGRCPPGHDEHVRTAARFSALASRNGTEQDRKDADCALHGALEAAEDVCYL